jgi:hypothetical protein
VLEEVQAGGSIQHTTAICLPLTRRSNDELGDKTHGTTDSSIYKRSVFVVENSQPSRASGPGSSFWQLSIRDALRVPTSIAFPVLKVTATPTSRSGRSGVQLRFEHPGSDHETHDLSTGDSGATSSPPFACSDLVDLAYRTCFVFTTNSELVLHLHMRREAGAAFASGYASTYTFSLARLQPTSGATNLNKLSFTQTCL